MAENEGRGIAPKIGTLIGEVFLNDRDLIEVYQPKTDHASQPNTSIRFNIVEAGKWSEEKTVTWPNGTTTTYAAGYPYKKTKHFMTLAGLETYLRKAYDTIEPIREIEILLDSRNL